MLPYDDASEDDSKANDIMYKSDYKKCLSLTQNAAD